MLYLFDKNENLIHELASSELESLIQHEELNKLMTLEFAVFIESNYKMDDIEYVAHKDMENYQQIQMYRVISSESDDYTVNYQAVHIIFDELKSYGYIRDKRPDKVKASAALDIALAGSRWKVGRVDDSDLLSASFYDLTRLDALSKIIKTWNLDLHFYLTFDGNKITGRYIDLLSFRGEDTGERFVYGSNAIEVIKEVDKSEVYTRVIPRGKGEEKTDEKGKPTDGYGRRIKIDDVIWEKSKGNPIDKPKGQEYLELKEMTNKFGFSDGEARTRVQIFEDIEDPKELIKAGYDFLVKVSRPLVQFKTKISKRSRTNVGDIVRIIRKDLDFYYRTRIYKAHRNLLNETLEVEFGDKLVTSPADRQKIVSDNLNALENRLKETETDLKSSFVDKVNEGITHATFNRDGYNYELKKGNKYGLPAGYYSFDREIDDNPQSVIYVGAGTLAIADSKKSNGDWNFRTFGTGQGFVADLLVAGTILGGKVRWNLEDGTLLIGNSPDDYNLYWDGETLNLRNTKIDFRYDKTIKDLKDNIDKKISKEDVLEDKEIQEALRGKDGLNGPPGQDGKDGMPGPKGADGKTSYMHFAYADSKDGVVGFTLTATTGKKYIGFYTDFTKEDSKDPNKYEWSKYDGKDGGEFQWNLLLNGDTKIIDSKSYEIKSYKLVEPISKGTPMSLIVKAKGKRGTGDLNKIFGFISQPPKNALNGRIILPSDSNLNYNIYVLKGTWQGTNPNDMDFRLHFGSGVLNTYDPVSIEWVKLVYGSNPSLDFAPARSEIYGKDGVDGKDGKTGKIGQNLLRNSNVPVSNKDYPTNKWTLCETPETGETMTFTAKLKLEKDDKLKLHNSGGNINLNSWTGVSKSEDYVIYTSTFKWKHKSSYDGKTYEQANPPTLILHAYSNGNGDNKNQNEVSIEWATLTRGDIPAIEWSPCYADVDDAISEKASEESLQDLQVHFAMYPTAEELNQNKIDLMKQQAYLDQLKTAIDSNALSLEDRLSIIEANVGAGKLSLEAINTYLHFGEEGVLIGKEGEQVRLRLINNALEITDGTKVVARFANNQTETPNLKVTGAFEFGYHVASKVDLDGNKYTVISSNI